MDGAGPAAQPARRFLQCDNAAMQLEQSGMAGDVIAPVPRPRTATLRAQGAPNTRCETAAPALRGKIDLSGPKVQRPAQIGDQGRAILRVFDKVRR